MGNIENTDIPSSFHQSGGDLTDSQGVEKVSEEKVESIVDRFSQLYEIPIERNKSNFDIYIFDPSIINEEISAELFKEYLGIDMPARPKDIDNVIKKHQNALGEWLPSRNFGFVFTSAKEKFGQEAEDRVISHEIIHAIASSKDGGFVKGSIWSRILSNDMYSINPKMANLNEGATELLNIGLEINSADINDIKQAFINRLRNIQSKESYISYPQEVTNLIRLLEVGGISPKELARLYMQGDYMGLVIKSRGNIEKQMPDLKTCSNQDFDEYMGKISLLDKMSDELGLPIIV